MAVKTKEVRRFQRAVRNSKQYAFFRRPNKLRRGITKTPHALHTLFGEELKASAKGVTMPSDVVIKKCETLSKTAYKKTI